MSISINAASRRFLTKQSWKNSLLQHGYDEHRWGLRRSYSHADSDFAQGDRIKFFGDLKNPEAFNDNPREQTSNLRKEIWLIKWSLSWRWSSVYVVGDAAIASSEYHGYRRSASELTG